MNILITGGAGFIGTALTKKLLSQKCTISVIDLPAKINSSELISGVDYHQADISDYDSISQFENAEFDFIFHLASQTSGLISHEDPSLDVDTNVKGTLNICRLASSMEGVKIIFTSSMAVYGDYKDPITEEFIKFPRSNYGVSKIAAETYLKLFEQRGVRSSVFRLFNVYGPGQDLENMKQGMLSIYLSQLIQTGSIYVTGSFDRYRDFVYIDDIVDALLIGLLPESDGAVFNVGTGIKTTVKDLIDLIIKESNKEDVVVKNIGPIMGDQFGTFSNSAKIRALGWNPKVSLSQGLKSTYEDAMKVLA